MSRTSPSIGELAELLQRIDQAAFGEGEAADLLINDNLRLSLTRFVGAEGYASLLKRSLSLTRATMPSLRGVQVHKDGRVEGIEDVFSNNAIAREEAAIAVTTQLLELLIAFLGEPLTRRIVREACPGESTDE